MGLLRILLAICVFCAHSKPIGGLRWVGGDLAVELFFVISGFYMQLVLNGKYTPENLGKSWVILFYLARYFRLFPAYICAGLFVFGVALFWNNLAPFPVLKAILELPDTFGNIAFKSYIIFTNATIFFQDIAVFLSVNGDKAEFSVNFRDSAIPVWQGLAVPQAWSLGVELSFYFIAPYLLNCRARILIGVLLSCFTAKFTIITLFHLGDPWTYRFFPFELGYFLTGAMAFRYRSYLDSFMPERYGKYLAYPVAICIAALGLPGYVPNVIYPFGLACALPFLFRMTSNLRGDRLIGELSYPFYVLHVFGIWLGSAVVTHWFEASRDLIVWTGLGLTLCLSAVALTLETYLVEPWRARLAERRVLQ